MREILFRGKTYKNEWAYGLLAVGKDLDWASILPIETIDDAPPMFAEIEVEPETVGQYTGLCDKNGTKIFERDIVKQTMTVNGETIQKVADIIYNDGSYWLSYSNNQIFKLSQNTVDIYKLEVIGNLYDNHELLEVAE